MRAINLAVAAVVLCCIVPAMAQTSPVSQGSIPVDLRRVSSLGDDRPLVVFDPVADPLSIDPLMRPLDTEHTWEYLDKVSGRAYAPPGYASPAMSLAGEWRISLGAGDPGQLSLVLFQSGEVVFGRGTLSSSSGTADVVATGQTALDVLYMDVILPGDLILYKFTLTRVGADTLSGSYQAYVPQGRTWSGTASGGRPA